MISNGHREGLEGSRAATINIGKKEDFVTTSPTVQHLTVPLCTIHPRGNFVQDNDDFIPPATHSRTVWCGVAWRVGDGSEVQRREVLQDSFTCAQLDDKPYRNMSFRKWAIRTNTRSCFGGNIWAPNGLTVHHLRRNTAVPLHDQSPT